MFCDKSNVNLLTASLTAADIRDIVVCPGSRNAVLLHNFHQWALREGWPRLHPVTDERSAAFIALGLAVATQRPVAICVTSGSALLNTLPAVAEAYYRQQPLLILSADRPEGWVGQLDGQTLPQTDALRPYAATYTLPEDNDELCRARCHEALSALYRPQTGSGRPVHINLPISEPLFTFTTPALPADASPRSPLSRPTPNALSPDVATSLIEAVRAARFPLIVCGQRDSATPSATAQALLDSHAFLLLPELISRLPGSRRTALLEQHPEWMEKGVTPDLVVHIGGNMVNKRLKLALRQCHGCRVIRIEEGDDRPDTFRQHATFLPVATDAVLSLLATADLPEKAAIVAAAAVLDAAHSALAMPPSTTVPFTSAIALQQVAVFLREHDIRLRALHVANSSIVRHATRCFADADFPVVCNRGVNGIEGSLSTAVGYALGTGTGDDHSSLQLMLIGDLSFFYDNNALWNKKGLEHLRIILFNDGGGRIFHALPGLDASPARDTYIAAHHHTSARGIAESYGIDYTSADSLPTLLAALPQLLASIGKRPRLLEIFHP
jgi:2-succinyl-5-enolpyruvyl-6-hydroxy-3-cyclohexene-1-carboxylate synthase